MQHISHCMRMIKEYTKVPHGFHLAQSFLVELTLNQSVTYRYREFFIFLLVSEPVSEQIGTGKKCRNRYRKNLVPEKVSEPVSENFDTGTDFHCQNLGILKIYNGYRYRIGTGTV